MAELYLWYEYVKTYFNVANCLASFLKSGDISLAMGLLGYLKKFVKHFTHTVQFHSLMILSKGLFMYYPVSSEDRHAPPIKKSKKDQEEDEEEDLNDANYDEVSYSHKHYHDHED